MPVRATAAICICLLGASMLGSCSSAPPGPAVSELPGSSWSVMTIEGIAVLVDALPTMEFSEDGRISGTTGANDFFGPVAIDGDRITIGPVGTTRRAAPPEVMEQERRFLEALGETRRFEVQQSLLLLRGDGPEPLIRLAIRTLRDS